MQNDTYDSFKTILIGNIKIIHYAFLVMSHLLITKQLNVNNYLVHRVNLLALLFH